MTTAKADLASSTFSLENLTKVIGALTAVALGTGILFDVVYFYVINRSFLELMVLSDHIESAAAAVPPLLVFLLLMSSALWVTRRRGRQLRYSVLIATIAILITIWAGMLILAPVAFGRSIDASSAISTGAVLLLFFVVVVVGARAPKMPESRLVFLLCAAWVGLTVVRSGTEAFQATSSSRFAIRPPSQIFLANEGMITGGVVRLLDKGAIIFSEPGGRYIFIPKEQIRRIDSFPRRNPG